jgi:hypothetical protein
MLVAIPMVVILFVGFFRLDNIFAGPPKKQEWGKRLSNWDRDGQVICTDPDGRPSEGVQLITAIPARSSMIAPEKRPRVARAVGYEDRTIGH